MRLRKFTEEDKKSAKDDLWNFFGNERGHYADYFEFKLTRELIEYYFDIYYYCYEVYCRRYEEDMSFDTEERDMCADYIAVKMGLYEPDETFYDQFVIEMLGIEKKIGKKLTKKLKFNIKNYGLFDSDKNEEPSHPFKIGKPQYFYNVCEYVTTFKTGEKLIDKIDFITGNLKKDREAAFEYYQDRFDGFDRDHHSFQSPECSENEVSTVYSLVLSLVEYYHEKSYFEYPIVGEDEATCVENREFEDDIINQQFISVVPFDTQV